MKRPYTVEEEIELAHQLFAEAKAKGTLKEPRALAAMTSSNGKLRTITASSVTYRDYLPDARRILEGRS